MVAPCWGTAVLGLLDKVNVVAGDGTSLFYSLSQDEVGYITGHALGMDPGWEIKKSF